MSLGNKLIHLREMKDISRKEISEKLNISYGSYSKYESDERSPSFEILISIADFFNVSIDFLFARYTNSQIMHKNIMLYENPDFLDLSKLSEEDKIYIENLYNRLLIHG